jgi:D-glycero-D-manno-heptose 1,7-bisphosphate phosphatase
MTPSAVLMDRDGVVNVDAGYIWRPDQIIWVPGFFYIARKLKEKGVPLYLITNQSGIARGLFTEDQARFLMDWMCDTTAARGGKISGYYLCPHHPQGVVFRYAAVCECRKPKSGLIEQCISDHQLDRRSTIMIGDKESDITAASSAGIAGYLFDGGNLKTFVHGLVDI